MDEETARKLWDIVLARAGLLGKTDGWSEEDKRRSEIELNRMPGEFREYLRWTRDKNNPHNIELAKSYGMDVETLLRLSNAGAEEYMRHLHHPESDQDYGYTPNIPGNTYGVGIGHTMVTPS